MNNNSREINGVKYFWTKSINTLVIDVEKERIAKVNSVLKEMMPLNMEIFTVG